MILCDADGITETLEMVDFALAKEFDGIAHVRIVHKTEDIIIRCARFLLCCNGVCTTN